MFSLRAHQVLGIMLLGLVCPSVVIAKPKGEPKMLVQAKDLEALRKETNFRLLDTRSKDDYTKGHIPGAQWVDVGDFRDVASKKGGFQDEKAWAELVGGLGVDNDSTVVVYGDSPSNTARLWWMLKYAGLTDVRILDGGWNYWVGQKLPTETLFTTVAKTNFVPKLQADRLSEIDSLKKEIEAKKVQVLDTRSEDEFTGKEVRGKRGGHIPGATHLEWKELLAKDGRFKSVEELKELFRKRGVAPDDPVVCY